MSEDKQLPAEQPAATSMPLMPMSTGVTKASEKVEMQRVTADVYAMHQRAMQQGRDEKLCAERLVKMCTNVDFASSLLYKVSRGADKVEGIGIDGANEIARVWGHIDSGSVVHGVYGDEVQMEAFATDLVGPRRRSSRFTVKATRTYENKDPKTGETTYNTVPVKNLDDIMKGTAAKEERNCILDVIPSWLKGEMVKTAKRAMSSVVTNVGEAFNLNVKKFAGAGVTEEMLWAYINKKPGDKDRFDKVTAADIVDLRLLSASAREDKSVLDEYFPKRNKNVQSPDEGEVGAVATQLPKSKGAKPATKAAPEAAPASNAPAATAPTTGQSASAPATSAEVATEVPKSSPAPTTEATFASGADTSTETTAAASEDVPADFSSDQTSEDASSATPDSSSEPKRKVNLW